MYTEATGLKYIESVYTQKRVERSLFSYLIYVLLVPLFLPFFQIASLTRKSFSWRGQTIHKTPQ